MFHYMGPADLDICGVPMVESDAERGASAPGAAVVVILGVCILCLQRRGHIDQRTRHRLHHYQRNHRMSSTRATRQSRSIAFRTRLRCHLPNRRRTQGRRR